MNASEHHKRNRRLGLVLCLLFVGLFTIAMTALVTGSKIPSPLEEVVKNIGTPSLGVIGLLLIVTAVVEIIIRILRKT